jgi:hypothetical protein
MTHTDALNKILAHSCPKSETNGVSLFHLDLCCNEVYVEARYIGDHSERHDYEILSVELVEYSTRSPVRNSEV